jgi:hypothetical protein
MNCNAARPSVGNGLEKPLQCNSISVFGLFVNGGFSEREKVAVEHILVRHQGILRIVFW